MKKDGYFISISGLVQLYQKVSSLSLSFCVHVGHGVKHIIFIQVTRAKLDCSRRLTFFCKNLSQARDDDRVTHIVLQGFETNGIRALRRLNSIEG